MTESINPLTEAQKSANVYMSQHIQKRKIGSIYLEKQKKLIQTGCKKILKASVVTCSTMYVCIEKTTRYFLRANALCLRRSSKREQPY